MAHVNANRRSSETLSERFACVRRMKCRGIILVIVLRGTRGTPFRRDVARRMKCFSMGLARAKLGL